MVVNSYDICHSEGGDFIRKLLPLEFKVKIMKKINDSQMMDNYIVDYGITDFFSSDMKPYMELLMFKRNEHIIKENEKISYLFFFIEGKAKVYTTLSNGKSLLLCFYQGLKVLGDVEFINDEVASSNVQVIEDTYCVGISLEKARVNLLNDVKFLRFICNSLGGKLNRCSKNSSINLLYPLENRLASYILATVESVNNSGKKSIVFNENLTEISELLGTSYRHLLRTLNTLCYKGAIKRKSSYFEVINEEILKKSAVDLYQ